MTSSSAVASYLERLRTEQAKGHLLGMIASGGRMNQDLKRGQPIGWFIFEVCKIVPIGAADGWGRGANHQAPGNRRSWGEIWPVHVIPAELRPPTAPAQDAGPDVAERRRMVNNPKIFHSYFARHGGNHAFSPANRKQNGPSYG